MITPSKQTHNAAGPTGIRLSVWLLVRGALLVILVAICLPRPGATKAPETVSNASGGDVAATAPASPQSTSGRFVVSTTEPIQRKTFSGWVLDLESTNAEVVHAARRVLKDLGPDAAPAIPQLAQMLNDGRTCNSAAWALVDIGTNSLPVLLDALTNGNKYSRLEVAGSLGSLREAAEQAVPGLVECMKYDDPGVRANAIASLQMFTARPDIAVPALVACLSDPDTRAHGNATTVLENYGRVEAKTTIAILAQAATKDQNQLVRLRAAEILRTIAAERAKSEGF
jgi:hypothetical protein